jgi:hypothetical protein
MELINYPQATFLKNELVINEDITIDEWKELGESLVRVEIGVQFWIGDWARFGEKKGFYTDEISKITGLARQTIQDYRWVADSVNPLYRKEDLSFSHHKEVAGLEQEKQTELLNRAIAEKLTVRDLRTLASKASWKQAWEGMPEYDNQDLGPVKRLIVNFVSLEDMQAFAELVGQKLTPKTRSINFPQQPIDIVKNLRWV